MEMNLEELLISESLKIRELALNELEQTYPVINQLRKHLSLESYISHVKAMSSSGYQIACLFEYDNVVSYVGFERLLNLYYGDHIWVYDLVTDEKRQGNGYGKMLLSYVEKLAKENSLNCVALSSGLQREDAHKFYEQAMSYSKASYVFKKSMM